MNEPIELTESPKNSKIQPISVSSNILDNKIDKDPSSSPRWKAWYSEQQKNNKINLTSNNRGPAVNIYLSEHGNEVAVTEVMRIRDGDEDRLKSCFSDAQDRGIVVKWLRHA